MKKIVKLFSIVLLITSCTQKGSPPPQAQPIVTLLEAVNSNNAELLKSAMSKDRLKLFSSEDSWNEGLEELKQQVFDFYGTTNLNLNAFYYEYIGNDESGQIIFTYKTQKDSIDVVKENDHWKMSGPTRGFN